MILRIKGVDGEPDEVHEWHADRIRNDEAMALERAHGYSFAEWNDKLTGGSISALTGLVWILRRRVEPGLRLDAVRFEIGSVSMELADDEVKQTRDALKGNAEKLAEFDAEVPADQLARVVDATEVAPEPGAPNLDPTEGAAE